MAKEKLLETLNVNLKVSKSTQSYHNDNYHYYKGRADAFKEVLRLLELESEGEESEKGEK